MAFQLLQDCNDMLCDMTSTEHAVLMVLCRYANEEGGDCFPSVPEIARCSHFAENPVRRALSSLQASGWIESSQQPGKKRFFSVNVARIKGAVSEVPNQTPPADQQGVSDPHPLTDQQGVSNQYPLANQQPLADQQPHPLQISKGTPCRSATRKEQYKNIEKNTPCDPASFESVSQSPSDFGIDDAHEFKLTPETKPDPVKDVETPKKPAKKAAKKTAPLNFYGLPENLIEDWKINRKKRPLTQTAIDGFKREAAKAGIDFEAAVRMSVERGWQGFQARWFEKDGGTNPFKVKPEQKKPSIFSVSQFRNVKNGPRSDEFEDGALDLLKGVM